MRSSTVFRRIMRSVLDIGRSHIDTASPSTEHNENFLPQRKGQLEFELGQIFNDLRDLNHLWTVRDLYGQTAPSPVFLRSFSFDAILRLARANLRHQRRISAPTMPKCALWAIRPTPVRREKALCHRRYRTKPGSPNYSNPHFRAPARLCSTHFSANVLAYRPLRSGRTL